MKKAEYYIALILCLFGVFIFLTSNTIPLMVAVEKGEVINARFFPKLMGFVLVILSFIMSLENYFQRPSQEGADSAEEEQKKPDKKGWLRLFSVGVICLFYFILFEALGYLISSVLFMLGFLLVLGNRKWYVLLSLSILAPLSVYVFFKILLESPLPEGIFYF